MKNDKADTANEIRDGIGQPIGNGTLPLSFFFEPDDCANVRLRGRRGR